MQHTKVDKFERQAARQPYLHAVAAAYESHWTCSTAQASSVCWAVMLSSHSADGMCKCRCHDMRHVELQHRDALHRVCFDLLESRQQKHVMAQDCMLN